MGDTINKQPGRLYLVPWRALLHGDFKPSKYGRVILRFTLLRRLEEVLEKNKAAVLAEHATIPKMKLPEEAQEELLLRATGGLSFYNISKMDLGKLGEADIKVTWSRI